MPVQAAEDGVRLSPGPVYVGQPGKITAAREGHLVVSDSGPAERVPTVIDRF